MYVCVTCKEEKEFIDFHKNKSKKNGIGCQCKVCVNKHKIIYRKENKEKIKNGYLLNKKYYKDYYKNNKEKVDKYIYKWRESNKDRVNLTRNKQVKEKRLNDPLFKLTGNIRTLIGLSIRKNGYSKKSKTNKILGCSFEDFKLHLQKQFTEGMTWENLGQWHLDHIYPVSLAKSEEEIIRLNHYTNFQPLWAIDNIKKGNKIIEKQLVLI